MTLPYIISAPLVASSLGKISKRGSIIAASIIVSLITATLYGPQFGIQAAPDKLWVIVIGLVAGGFVLAF